MITPNIDNIEILIKPKINTLKIIFDSTLQLHYQVQKVITKGNKAKHAISLIRKYLDSIVKITNLQFYSKKATPIKMMAYKHSLL